MFLSPYEKFFRSFSVKCETLVQMGTVFENYRKKVSFNIASEASYVYACQKIVMFGWRVFENLKLDVKQCYQTVLTGLKLSENAKIQMRHF